MGGGGRVLDPPSPPSNLDGISWTKAGVHPGNQPRSSMPLTWGMAPAAFCELECMANVAALILFSDLLSDRALYEA